MKRAEKYFIVWAYRHENPWGQPIERLSEHETRELAERAAAKARKLYPSFRKIVVADQHGK